MNSALRRPRDVIVLVTGRVRGRVCARPTAIGAGAVAGEFGTRRGGDGLERGPSPAAQPKKTAPLYAPHRFKQVEYEVACRRCHTEPRKCEAMLPHEFLYLAEFVAAIAVRERDCRRNKQIKCIYYGGLRDSQTVLFCFLFLFKISSWELREVGARPGPNRTDRTSQAA